MSRVFHMDRNGDLFVWQDKDETLDYTLDWSRWLVTGDAISTATLTTDGGVSVASQANDTATNTMFVKGTGGKVTTTIVTTGGRTKQETLEFREKVN